MTKKTKNWWVKQAFQVSDELTELQNKFLELEEALKILQIYNEATYRSLYIDEIINRALAKTTGGE